VPLTRALARALRQARPALAAAGLALAALAAAAAPARAETVTVFAAASLRSALEDIAGAWEAETGHTLTVASAGSSALARQIRQGAPADIFLSANPGWMDALDEEGLIETESRVDLLGNRLVVVAPAGGDAARPLDLARPGALAERLGTDRLAMALVDAVPAGIYGRAALEALGQWESVAPQVAQADNVRAALALVATGAAPLGIVYATDARAEPRVTVVAEIPAHAHPPIVYPAAILAGRAGPAVLAAFAAITGPEGRAAFARHGFSARPAQAGGSAPPPAPGHAPEDAAMDAPARAAVARGG
jgi:molybdate transport system substrate-binding protein